jgi:4'-phosphopantetheinyl transferase
MPLVQLERIDENTAWGLWEIQEPLEALQEKLMRGHHPISIPAHIHHLEKKREWLSARLTVASLCESLHLPFFGTEQDALGKPSLVGHQAHVSISHSGCYAAAIVDKQNPTGIDIELIRPKIQAVAARFLHTEEWEEDIIRQSLKWSIKETAYKAYGRKQLNLKDEIRIVLMDDGHEGSAQVRVEKEGAHFLTIEFQVIQDYALAIVR